jgi:nitrogen fixation protein FixH
MKKFLFLVVAALMATMSAMAQISLTGRVYHQPNIMASMFAGKIDIDKQIAEARKKKIAETEKKIDRKLTQEETDEVDKEIARKKGEIEQKVRELENAIVLSMTIEFTSATDAVVRMKGKADEKTMK